MKQTNGKPVHAVISDWCGTIESNITPRIDAIQSACTDLKLKKLTHLENQKISGMTQTQAIKFIAELNQTHIDHKIFKDLISKYRKHHQSKLIMTKPTQEWLTSHTRLCLFTNGYLPYVHQNLKKYGLESCFEEIATADQYMAKPSPEMIESILKKIEISSENCLIIGDHPFDLLAAHAANTRCVIVQTGISSPEDFVELPPAFAQINSINDLPDIIQSINNPRQDP